MNDEQILELVHRLDAADTEHAEARAEAVSANARLSLAIGAYDTARDALLDAVAARRSGS